MNPSEAKVFSAGISGMFSKRRDVTYQKLNSCEDSLDFSTVNFQREQTSICGKICFGLLALMLLTATVVTSVFIMNFKSYTVEFQLEQGNTLAYRFEQEVKIKAKEEIRSNITAFVSMHVVNKTDNECWFGILISFPDDKFKSMREFAFLARVTNKEPLEQGGLLKHFSVFGDPETDPQFLRYVYNTLNQLLPYIKVKLYQFVLSKVSSSYGNTVVDNHGFFPGRVHISRTMITRQDTVTVTTKANPDDFEDFVGSKANPANWKVKYDETTVVNKKTGMVKRSDMYLTSIVPFGGEFAATNERDERNFTVKFKSVVKSIDPVLATGKDFKTVAKDRLDSARLIPLPSSLQCKLLYFAPIKKTRDATEATALIELLELEKHTVSRSTKLPSMIKNVRDRKKYAIDRGDFSDLDNDYDDGDNDDADERGLYNHSDRPTGDGDNGDDKLDYDADKSDSFDDNDEDDDDPPWPAPNFAPFGFQYPAKRKRRAMRISKRESGVSLRKIKRKSYKKSQQKPRNSDLDIIWDELRSSSPDPVQQTPRVIQTSFLGLPIRAEIKYEVHSQRDDDDNDFDEWDVTTSYAFSIGQYQATAFRREHRLKNLRRKLPRKGERKTSRWTVKAGDFMICASLLFIHKLCVEMRLTFDVTVTHSVSRLSQSFPVNLVIHIEQTVKANATLSTHASTWLLEGGLYSKGTLAVAHLPVKLSFNEDTRPEWCTNTNLRQDIVRINNVPFLSWKCTKRYGKVTPSCQGPPKTLNGTSVDSEPQFTPADSALFEHWHYPIMSCVHKKSHSNDDEW